MSFSIPPGFARTNAELHGAEGITWLASLPALISECEKRWSLTVGPPFPDLSYNYAAPATRRDGTPAVLKMGFPSRELKTEAEALRIYGGRGAVQLLDADVDKGVLLLERITPGTLLSSVEDDQEATHIAADVMKHLWRPAPQDHPFPTVDDWAGGMLRLREHFGGGSGPFPPRLVNEAERLFKQLIPTMSEPVLLHGDLHHFNMLAAKRQPWLAIDPKGLVGEPAYEVGALLRNPAPLIASRSGLVQITRRRVDQLAEELGFERERIRGWGLAQAVLSAWWTIEDGGSDWGDSIAVAEALSSI